jgi:selT/selW/selH-like putative selenoprotein
LAAEIEKEFGVQPKLVEGDDGIFDVEVDGDLIFSKHGVGRFPEPEEVLAKLR